MGSPKQTAVNLTENAQKIKDDLAPVYGLKNILSAGLVLFGQLSADKQRDIIKLVSLPTSSDTGKQDNAPDEDTFRRKIIQIVRTAGSLEVKKSASPSARTPKHR